MMPFPDGLKDAGAVEEGGGLAGWTKRFVFDIFRAGEKCRCLDVSLRTSPIVMSVWEPPVAFCDYAQTLILLPRSEAALVSIAKHGRVLFGGSLQARSPID